MKPFLFFYRNGGGAFLIPFAIMMCIIGVPLFFMESSIGQFSSRGPMTCWDFAPVFKGTGPVAFHMTLSVCILII